MRLGRAARIPKAVGAALSVVFVDISMDNCSSLATSLSLSAPAQRWLCKTHVTLKEQAGSCHSDAFCPLNTSGTKPRAV